MSGWAQRAAEEREDRAEAGLCQDCGQDPDLHHRMNDLERENDKLKEELGKLQKFKDYVHQRLDIAGVHPHGEQNAINGCRIGSRLDDVLDVFQAAKAYAVPDFVPNESFKAALHKKLTEAVLAAELASFAQADSDKQSS